MLCKCNSQLSDPTEEKNPKCAKQTIQTIEKINLNKGFKTALWDYELWKSGCRIF